MSWLKLDLQQVHQGQCARCIPTKKQRTVSPTPDSSCSEYTLSDIEPVELDDDDVCEAEGTSNTDETMSFEQGDYVLIRFQTKKHQFYYVGIM